MASSLEQWILIVSLMSCLSIPDLAKCHIIPMGSSVDCDDGVKGTEIDWDTRDTTPYTCPQNAGTVPKYSNLLDSGKSEKQINMILNLDADRSDKFPFTCSSPLEEGIVPKTTVFKSSKLPLNGMHHICIHENISYDVPWPASGNHRPAWPQYGSYTYLPPQRWLHNLEHGAIVGLYNPCAGTKEVEKFQNAIACAGKESASGSQRLFVITPEIKTPTCLPFILLSWQYRLMMATVDRNEVVRFFKDHYAKGPEKTTTDGQYNLTLQVHANNLNFGDCSWI